MKKVVVTGANGFVGTAVCKELLNRGVQVIAVIRNHNSEIESIEKLEGIQFVYCDLNDLACLPSYIQDRDIDVFYHLAWAGSAGEQRSDFYTQIENIRYTCEAVCACRALNCKRFVFASSIMEYEIISIMENDKVPHISTLYSTAKLSSDYMAKTIANSKGIEYIRAVISNIYGPGESSPRLINSTIRKMLNNEHCSFSSCEQKYDFIYITDAAKAIYAVGEKGIPNRTYYIGSKAPKKLKDYLVELRNIVNPNTILGFGEMTYNCVSLSYTEFDINAVKRDTGFSPEVPFSEGISNTVQWIKDNG